MKNLKKSVLTFDSHVPFEDKKLWRCIRSFCSDLEMKKNDELILGGDTADFWAISTFDRIPTSLLPIDALQYERTCIKEHLRDNRKAIGKSAKIIYLRGNHEERIEKIMGRGNATCFYGIPELQISTFLDFKKYGVTYFPHIYKVGKYYIIKHGTSCSKYPSRAELDREGISGASGHAHREDRAFKRGYETIKLPNGKLFWHNFGHTADKRKIDEACKYSKSAYWEQSIGLLITDIKTGWFDLEIMHCDNKGFYSKFLQKEYKR